MAIKRPGTSDVVVAFPESAPKRKRSSGRSLGQIDIPDHINALKKNVSATKPEHPCSPDDHKDKSINIASTAKFADQAVAPFLTRHIPDQYAPLGSTNDPRRQLSRDSNSKFCYRHRPDLLCRRQADEPSMDQLQRVR